MSRSELHDWEYHFERCCKEMKEIAENIYDTAYARGANSKEPKTGHWIVYDVHGHKACKCSECGMDVGYPCNDAYCKYCGAKIESER